MALSTTSHRVRLAAAGILAGVLVAGALGAAAVPASGKTQPLWAQAPGNEAVDHDWSVDSDCASCHGVQGASLENDKCQIAKGGIHSTLDCVVCHDDVEGLEKAHENMIQKKVDKLDKLNRLKRTEVSQEVCASCHTLNDDGVLVDAKGKPVPGGTLTDSEGNTVDAHDLPKVEHHEGIACGNCHSMHSQETAVETAEEFCLSCHHANVYECQTCHK